MTDEIEIFFEIHKDLSRESPGGEEYTQQALRMLPSLSYPHILDIGCGPGSQTLKLAQLTNGQITAIDTHQPFLDRLQATAIELGIADRIQCLNQTMFELPFAADTFDVLWSEGAIYIIGFEQGLKQWQRVIKPSGYLVISELVWLQPNPPEPVQTFWRQAYPKMRTLEQAIQLISECGYRRIGHFVLPQQAWWNYYHPIEARIAQLRSFWEQDAEKRSVLEQEQQEIEMYHQYHEWYGYAMLVMQKS
jgi:ubiquinone/menaquinone biosynthesis C-methylase UbiE